MYKRPSVVADVRWYVYDGLGSVVGEVDVSGTMLATKKHDVYGVARAGGTGTAKSKHGFVGSLGHYSDDETGLVYWYVYCANYPVNKVDVTGKSWAAALNGILTFLGLAAEAAAWVLPPLALISVLNMMFGCLSDFFGYAQFAKGSAILGDIF